MPNDSQKHLNNKELPSKQNKRYLVHFKFFESLKSIPDSLKDFKSLRVRVLEITGDGGPPPLSIRCRYQHLSMERLT